MNQNSKAGTTWEHTKGERVRGVVGGTSMLKQEQWRTAAGWGMGRGRVFVLYKTGQRSGGTWCLKESWTNYGVVRTHVCRIRCDQKGVYARKARWTLSDGRNATELRGKCEFMLRMAAKWDSEWAIGRCIIFVILGNVWCTVPKKICSQYEQHVSGKKKQKKMQIQSGLCPTATESLNLFHFITRGKLEKGLLLMLTPKICPVSH